MICLISFVIITSRAIEVTEDKEINDNVTINNNPQ